MEFLDIWSDRKEQLGEIEKAKTALFKFLKDKYPNILQIAVSYDGNGDEGFVEYFACHDKDNTICEVKDGKLDELIDELFVVATPEGFENNEGGGGEIIVEVSAKTVEVRHYQNVVRQESMTYEV